MSASGKRCHYEVIGVSREASPEEIRSAYRRLALQLHPDKLVQSGLSQAEATSKFQELSLAYEVLSDPKERAWYDSHRSQILFSDPDAAGDSAVPDIFSFFSTSVYSGYGDSDKGFYKVYSDVFGRVYANEVSFVRTLGLGLEKLREAPVMGNLESPYEQVTAFYSYWLGFATVLDFGWADKYDASMGVNRKSRRVMEEENAKLRKKARREYNEAVRGLADFVKKRDKRVIDMMVRKSKEAEKRKEEERERKRRLEREKMERARGYEEPEWARVEEEEEVEAVEEEEEAGGNGKNELYCVVCGKKFKSEKQWKNHEQSKKHKDKVAELKHAFKDEDEDENIGGMDDFNEHEDDGVDHVVDELGERFREDLEVQEAESGRARAELEDDYVDAENGDGSRRADKKDGISEKDDGCGDDERSVLEAMLQGRKGKKTRRSRHVMGDGVEEVHVEDKDLEDEDMQYDNRKSRRRRSRKERGKNGGKAEDVKGDNDEGKSRDEETVEHDNEQVDEPSSQSFTGDDDGIKGDKHLEKNRKSSKNRIPQKEAVQKEANTNSKSSSKGKKGKAASKESGNMCQTCGEEFDSRNQLHKHLGDSGHASLKHR